MSHVLPGSLWLETCLLQFLEFVVAVFGSNGIDTTMYALCQPPVHVHILRSVGRMYICE